MMAPEDFDPSRGEDKEMPPEIQEKTPGVYVRADENELPHELDMLWSNNRPYHREERSPLISFGVGLLLGVILTTAVFLLFIMRPQVKVNGNELMNPVATEDLNNNASKSSAPGQANAPVGGQAGSQGGSTTYTVVNGDTLGRISQKVYGSADLQLQDKIQRANNMSSPNKLQINQKLIIPPKAY
jgi:hypothetical protein